MSDLTPIRISEHVYYTAPDPETDLPVLGAIAGQEATLIVDAGTTPAVAARFLGELAKLDIATPKYLVLTHSHWDHVFGASAFDMPIFAHRETRRLVEEMVDLDWSDEALDRRVAAGTEIEFCRDMIKVAMPDRTNLRLRAPDIAFETQIDFNLGGVHCQVKHVGGDHAADSVVVYVAEDNVIFLGDCMYVDLHHGPHHYTTRRLFPLMDQLSSYNAATYLWGHHTEPMTNEEMMAECARLTLVGRHVEQIGDDRESVIQALQDAVGGELHEEQLEIVDEFLAGLSDEDGG